MKTILRHRIQIRISNWKKIIFINHFLVNTNKNIRVKRKKTFCDFQEHTRDLLKCDPKFKKKISSSLLVDIEANLGREIKLEWDEVGRV